MKRRLMIGLLSAALVAAVPATASADVGDSGSSPASCMGIEAATLSPPGTSEEVPTGMPGVVAFVRGAGIPPGQFFSFVAQLHEGSHESCDEAIEAALGG